MASPDSTLRHISPDRIRRNPDNPRLIFRESEMQELLESIREVGIRVPISVYPDRATFRLIDGERRWKCAVKLNLPAMPAIVQPKPTRLQNILMMFNIHNVRLDWDLMPMALKLAEVRAMLTKQGLPASAKALAGITGVSLPTVRRAVDLMELPKRYQQMLLQEAEKPKDQQKIKVDLFVEINKSRRVIERYTPEVFARVSKAKYVDAMVDKYVTGVVTNVVRFRDISKIARAERTGVDRKAVIPILVRFVTEQRYTIERAYTQSVQAAYQRRDLVSKVKGLADALLAQAGQSGLTLQMGRELRRLRGAIDKLLGAPR